jgi:hypothetical protein
MEFPIESRSPNDKALVLPGRFRAHRRPKVAILLMLMAASLQGGTDGTPVGEYQLKAVFLFNFAKFVEWPSQAFADPHDPFAICVLGDNPFGSALDDAVRGKTVANRPIAIRLVSNSQQARTCQILFVTASEHKRMHGILEALRNCCVLTVGDTEDFTENGGIVQFRMKDARVRIEIDTEAAERASLRISSKLLSLAEPSRH